MKNASTIVFVVILTATGCSQRNYLAEGDRLFVAKNYPAAILIYRKAIQKEPFGRLTTSSGWRSARAAAIQRHMTRSAAAPTSIPSSTRHRLNWAILALSDRMAEEANLVLISGRTPLTLRSRMWFWACPVCARVVPSGYPEYAWILS